MDLFKKDSLVIMDWYLCGMFYGMLTSNNDNNDKNDMKHNLNKVWKKYLK